MKRKRKLKNPKWIALGMMLLLMSLQGNVLHAEATGQDDILESQAPSDGSTAGAVMMQVISEVNVREEADINSQSLGLVPEGTTVFVTGTQGEWRQILYQGQNAYIREDFLAPYGSDKQELTKELQETAKEGQAEYQKILAEEENAELEAQLEEAARAEEEKEAELERQRALEEAEKLAEENRNKTRRNIGIIIAAAAVLIAGYAAVLIYRDRHQHKKDEEEDQDDEEDDWDDDIEDLSGEE